MLGTTRKKIFSYKNARSPEKFAEIPIRLFLVGYRAPFSCFHEDRDPGTKRPLRRAERLSDPSFDQVASCGPSLGFFTHDHTQRRSRRRLDPDRRLLAGPDIEKTTSCESALFDEVFKSRLPAKPLLRREALFVFQSDLGQALSAFAATAREDFSPAFRPLAGQKAVFGTTFSFGGLIGPFHGSGLYRKNIRYPAFYFFCRGSLSQYLSAMKKFSLLWTFLPIRVKYSLSPGNVSLFFPGVLFFVLFSL